MRNYSALSSSSLQWTDPELVDRPQELLTFLPDQPFLVDALVRRGIYAIAQARPFLFPNHYSPCPSAELPDLATAANQIEAAIHSEKTIAVWGDFDVDGQTSTTILVSALRTLGARVMYHIPIRERESHGVNIPELVKLIDSGADLILTCDTGITAHDAVQYARQRGVDFLITDHHSLPPDLPLANAVVNPQRLTEGHPLQTLSGAGVAFKLAEELLLRKNKPDKVDELLDLVALGLVADLALLTADARYLVQRGIERIRNSPRLAIKTLLDLADVNRANFTEEHISFALAPRMNAIGRLSDANPMVEFLLTCDETEAKVTAARLDGLNAERKLLCDQAFQSALQKLDENPILLDSPVLVLGDPLWHPGVVGIVASRLVEIFHRPALLLVATDGGAARGSARSIDGIDITAAIREQADLLYGFGGHPMAAGLALPTEKIGELRFRLGESVLRQIAGQPLNLTLPIHAYLPLSAIDLPLVESFSLLAPFGQGNPPMTFATRNLVLRSSQTIGKTGEHLRLLVEDEAGTGQEVIWWQGAGAPLPEGLFDLAYTLRASDYQGRREVQVEWLDFRPVEVDVIELHRRTGKIQVEDYRLAPNSLETLEQICKETAVQVWQEGQTAIFPESKMRHQLVQSSVLAVWNSPPSRLVLQEAIQTVHPQKVLLFGQDPGMDDPQQFLTRLAGLVRYSINQREGRILLSELAAATSQTQQTVRIGLDWLAAKGAIQWTCEDEDRIQMISGGIVDPIGLQKKEKDLRIILEESAAFRSFYLRADPQVLVTMPESIQKRA